MKKLTVFAAIAALVSLASCTREDPYTLTVDAPETLTYLDHKYDEAQVLHRSILSASKFSSVFPIKVNKAKHDEIRATLTYDKAAAEAYNASEGTTYPILEESYIALSKYGDESAALEWTVPAGERTSVDSVQFALKGDLSALQEPVYLAAYRLEAKGGSVSEEYGTYILKVTTEHSLIRKITALSELVGSSPADRSAWTADVDGYEAYFTGDGSYSWGASYPDLTDGQVITVDLHEEHLITGLKIYTAYGYANASDFMYSTDGTTFTSFGNTEGDGTITTEEGNATVQAVAFYDYVPARYIRFTVHGPYLSWGYGLTGFNITEVTTTEAEISVSASAPFEGKIIHNMASDKHTSEFTADFTAMTTLSSATGYQVSAEYDGSLVAAFNAANGTSYVALPAENLNISGSPAKIAAGEMASAPFTVSLKGDLSGLMDNAGYLAPIALKCDGVKMSENSVAYVVITNSYVYLLSGITSAPGTEVTDKSGWSVTADVPSHSVYGSKDIHSIIDNDVTRDGVSHYQFYSWRARVTNIIVDFGTTLNVSGVRVNPTDLPCMDYDVAYSTDGTNFIELGTASMSTGTMANLNSDGVCGLYKAVPMTHLRVTMHSNYFGMYELGVFTK